MREYFEVIDLNLSDRQPDEPGSLSTRASAIDHQPIEPLIFRAPIIANVISDGQFANDREAATDSFSARLLQSRETDFVFSQPSAPGLEAVANSGNRYRFEEGVFPRIVINDAIGPIGAQNFATPFNAVVALSSGCTGTLIAPNVVLSARHCSVSPGSQIFFGPDSNNSQFTATVSSVTLPDGFGSLLDGGDVVIAFLSAAVPESVATPMRLIDATNSLVGRVATILGYGFNGVGSTGHGFSADGRRWGGENIIDRYGTPAGAFGSNIISTDFDDGSPGANTIAGSDPTPLEFEATTAPGDSGGPILVEQDGEFFIAGVLSGGTTQNSVFGDISWWTGIAPFRAQIEGAGGMFLGGASTIPDLHSNFLDDTATELIFNSAQIARDSGAINPVGDIDVFQFEILNPARVILDAIGLGGFDSFVSLFNNSGQLIGQNDNNPLQPNSLNSNLKIDLEEGRYFVAVTANNDASNGNYRVAARHNGPVDDHGGRFFNASQFELLAEGNTRINAVANFGDDVDMFSFVADRTGELVIRTKAVSGDLNTILRVWNQDRELIASNNNMPNSLDSLVSIEIEEGQRYFTHVDTVQQTAGDYRLVLIPKSDGRATGQRARVDLNFNQFATSQTRTMDIAQGAANMMNGWPKSDVESHNSLFVA